MLFFCNISKKNAVKIQHNSLGLAQLDDIYPGISCQADFVLTLSLSRTEAGLFSLNQLDQIGFCRPISKKIKLSPFAKT